MPTQPLQTSHSIQNTLNQSQQTQQTLDAASEFNVALVPSDGLPDKMKNLSSPPPYAMGTATYGTTNNGVFV